MNAWPSATVVVVLDGDGVRRIEETEADRRARHYAPVTE
ncbi:hypothetical protein HSTV1_8 [Haloarcula sinaiiensis tailed virus 1]|uniref:Uncharacterized protein n=1 Tax=Haloarcula sinaiiensis tailed virus 1 TaxID=1262530 RepID=R9QT35_9CAUD|nr:hypothetical protein HSTV1_8 [Haloarcula sinaiiensis tailed virus 1]AGC34553.1 hypothetical protein HSTV1_8 [Haloarcula sinaiiensis tailed virus 1]